MFKFLNFKAFSKNRQYKHFLSYDQIEGTIQIECGLTDLYYDYNRTTLFIKKIDHIFHEEAELQFPLKFRGQGIKTELEHFLINLMSYRTNFIGRPEYRESEIFTIDEFNGMLEKAISLMDERDNLAKQLHASNELIKFCREIGLNPQPAGTGPANWKANCISGGSHFLMISTESNTWGCGYCRKKGGIEELKEWHQNKKKSI